MYFCCVRLFFKTLAERDSNPHCRSCVRCYTNKRSKLLLYVSFMVTS